jgi:hypothetical protein
MHECVSCPPGATTLHAGSAAESDCVASSGHYVNGTAGFLLCPAGSYDPSPAMQHCLLCAAGATGPVVVQSNVECGCNQLGQQARPARVEMLQTQHTLQERGQRLGKQRRSFCQGCCRWKEDELARRQDMRMTYGILCKGTNRVFQLCQINQHAFYRCCKSQLKRLFLQMGFD